MEPRHEQRIGQSYRLTSTQPGSHIPEAPIPFPPMPATDRPFDGDRLGMRARLRREATCALIIEAELSAECVPLADRIQALQLCWLDELFHTPERIDPLLNPNQLTVAASALPEPVRASLPEPALHSEVALMEAIHQQLGVLRLIAPGQPHPRLRVSQLRQEQRWAELQAMLTVWEATLRSG